MSRLCLVLLLAVVFAVLPSTNALPTGAGGDDPLSGVWELEVWVDEYTEQGEDKLTSEEDRENAGESGFESLNDNGEGVQSAGEVDYLEDLEADVDQGAKKNHERDQNSLERSATKVELYFFKREAADSSEESSNEEQIEAFSEAVGDLERTGDEVPVTSKAETSEISGSPVTFISQTQASSEEIKPTTDSSPEKRDTEVLLEISPKEENEEVLVQAEDIDEDSSEDSETSDLEVAQSELNEIIFGEEEESAEEVNIEEGSDVSDSKTDDTQNEVSEEDSADYGTGGSSVQKRTATVVESADHLEDVPRDEPRILSPAAFFGHFEDDDSKFITDEED